MLFDALYVSPPLAATATAVDEPPIPACRAWAARYVARPEAPVIDLTQGCPIRRQTPVCCGVWAKRGPIASLPATVRWKARWRSATPSPPKPGAPHGLFGEPSWRDRVVQLYSFSKAYGIPGHRPGAPRGADQGGRQHPDLRAASAAGRSRLAIPALRGWREGNAATMARRAAAFAAALRQAPAWRIEALGAYFAWVRIPESMHPAAQAAEVLAATQGVVTLPRTAFGPGGERHLRMAFAGVGEAAIATLPARLRTLMEDGR